MSHVVEEFRNPRHKRYVARIVHDEFPSDPLDDAVGSITYRKGSRYTLGTEAVDEEKFESIKACIETGLAIGMPVFAYVHSGTALKAAQANPFSCPWDSGQSGFVYCTREKACDEWGTAADKLAMALGVEWSLSKEATDKALAYMACEVDTYGKYINGECYGIVIYDVIEDEDVESVWGFIGLDKYIEDEARRMLVEVATAETKRRRNNRVKMNPEQRQGKAVGTVASTERGNARSNN